MNNVLSTRIKIFRNIKELKFENKLTEEQKQQIIDLLQNALKNDMSYLNLPSADAKVISYLNSNDLIIGKTQNVFVSKKDCLAINMFIGEHISIISTCEGYDKKVITKAIDLSHDMSNKINFAYNDEFGYLMSDLNKIGTGIQIESNIMLSAIKSINKIDQLRQNVAKLGYSLNETKFPAVYTLSTRCNLGISEKKICEDFENTLIKLQELEIESVKMLDVSNHDEMLDKSQRSMAILSSAHLLNYDELYNIIVNLRMGTNLGIVNIETEKLNKLQKLITNNTNDIATQSEFKQLAEKAKAILKGE